MVSDLDWSPGQLEHYGRAELKQSDHRPVIAIINVEIYQVDERRRSLVFMEVIQDLGPPDATVIIQVLNLIFCCFLCSSNQIISNHLLEVR